jgi:hypothetical protein
MREKYCSFAEKVLRISSSEQQGEMENSNRNTRNTPVVQHHNRYRGLAPSQFCSLVLKNSSVPFVPIVPAGNKHR